MMWLETADPRHDVADSIARKDYRFWTVNGFAAGLVLGTDQAGRDRELIGTYGTCTIVGTSDNPSGPMEAHLNEVANSYAQTCNSLLIEFLRANNK
jgi:hypothetical protein